MSSRTEVITRWVECLNRHDAGACAELYNDDASIRVVFAPPAEGKAAIQKMFEEYFAVASLQCIVENLYDADGDRTVLEWRDKVGLRGVNIYEFVEGRIQRQNNYFDQLSFLRLNGLPLPTE